MAKLTESTTVMLTEDMRKAVERAAECDGLALGQEIRHLLRVGLEYGRVPVGECVCQPGKGKGYVIVGPEGDGYASD